VDPAYQSTLLTHARQLYDFADQYRGKYPESIPNAVGFYDSWSGYGDELGWAAAWLLRSTGDLRYQADVDRHYAEFGLNKQPYEFSWDEKTAGLQVLMAKATNNQTYRQQAERFCNYVVRDAPKTPKGLVFLGNWGALRHASNAVFLCLQVKSFIRWGTE
jgi:endoglucanase